MTREELIEVMARALCVDDGVDPDVVGYDRTGRDFPNWYVVQGTAETVLAALEAAGVRLVPIEGWQPIETAPRDGTQILACAQLSEHLTAAIISSQGHLPDLSIVKWDDREKDFIAMADGYMSIKSQGDNWTTYHEPYVTHWMPLPIPPATLKDTGQ